MGGQPEEVASCLPKKMPRDGVTDRAGCWLREEGKAAGRSLETLAGAVCAGWRRRAVQGQQKTQLVPESWLGRKTENLAARGQVGGVPLMLEETEACP